MLQELTQTIKKLIAEQIGNLHTSVIAKIVRADSRTVDVLPYATYTLPNGKRLPYPKLCNVPVFVSTDNKSAVAEGADCLVLFLERTLDIWKGAGDENITELQFDLTNAVAVAGIFLNRGKV